MRFTNRWQLPPLRGVNLPGWFAIGYAVIDALSNIDFVAENAGSVSVGSPYVTLIVALFGIVWLAVAGSRSRPSNEVPVSVYANREEKDKALGGLESELRSVREAWAAWPVGTYAHAHDVFSRTGRPQKMILLDPWSEYMKTIAALLGRTEKELESSILITTRMAHQAGLTVYWFKGPITSMLFGNPADTDAWVRLEIGFPITTDRPNVFISRRKAPDLYDDLRSIYEKMLDNPAATSAYERIAGRVHLAHSLFRLLASEASGYSNKGEEEIEAERKKDEAMIAGNLRAWCGEEPAKQFLAAGSRYGDALAQRIHRQAEYLKGIADNLKAKAAEIKALAASPAAAESTPTPSPESTPGTAGSLT